MDDTAATTSPRRVVAASELQSGNRRIAPRGMLWAKLQRMESTLLLLKNRPQASPEDRAFIDHLLERLEMARASITKRKKGEERARVLVNSTLFWSLVHEISADMLLVMPKEMLASEAMEVEQQFKQNIVAPQQRATWLGEDEKSGPLCVAVQRLQALVRRLEPPGPEEELELLHSRHVLRGALRQVNEHTDRAFQRLNLTLLIRGMSGALLLVLFFLAFLFNSAVWLSPPGDAEELWMTLARLISLIMLGAGGAIVANMLSEMPGLVTNGPRWRQFVFYLFIRPALGGFAAFLFYLLARSRLLFSIEAAPGPNDPELPPAIRIMLSTHEAVGFAYALIAIAVGFYAERVLGSTMDSVLDKLLRKAEKTVPTPGEPPVPPDSRASRASGTPSHA